MRKLIQSIVFLLFLLLAWSELSVAHPPADETPLSFTDSLIEAYKRWPDKGPVSNKRRATIMVVNDTIGVNDTLVVYHVYEELKKNRYYSTMDGKSVCSEYVDDLLKGCPGDSSYTAFWFCDCGYDSAIVINQRETNGPGIMANFENTKYVFKSPGLHTILWTPGENVSNTLTITVR
jgi:hypothetical protein